jgi:hypothetical protein
MKWKERAEGVWELRLPGGSKNGLGNGYIIWPTHTGSGSLWYLLNYYPSGSGSPSDKWNFSSLEEAKTFVEQREGLRFLAAEGAKENSGKRQRRRKKQRTEAKKHEEWKFSPGSKANEPTFYREWKGEKHFVSISPHKNEYWVQLYGSFTHPPHGRAPIAETSFPFNWSRNKANAEAKKWADKNLPRSDLEKLAQLAGENPRRREKVGTWGKLAYAPGDLYLRLPSSRTFVGGEPAGPLYIITPENRFIVQKNRFSLQCRLRYYERGFGGPDAEWVFPTKKAAKAFVEQKEGLRLLAAEGKAKENPPTSRTRAVRTMPRDMRVILADLLIREFPSVDLETYLAWEKTGSVQIFDVPLTTAHINWASSLQWDDRGPGQIERMAQDMLRGVEMEPVLLANGQIVDGRHRVLAAKSIGLKKLPAVELADVARRIILSWEADPT